MHNSSTVSAPRLWKMGQRLESGQRNKDVMWLGVAFVHQHRVSQNFSLPLGIFSTSFSYIKYWHRSPGTHGEKYVDSKQYFQCLWVLYPGRTLFYSSTMCASYCCYCWASFSTVELFIPILHDFFAFWTSKNYLQIVSLWQRYHLWKSVLFSTSPQEYRLD